VRPAAAVLAAAVLAGCGGGGEASTAGGGPVAAPVVLPVRVPTGAGRPAADATAFAIGGGRAITVAHVLRAGGRVLVATRPARVLHVDRGLDVAVLAIRGAGASAARTGAARAGEQVTLRVLRSGAVRSLRATVRRTITARMRGRGGRVRVRPALELATAVMPGDSGAPVLDGGGRVVGVVFAQAAGSEALAYALDARALRSVLSP
jgi:S1-C subfamily serine protease